VAIIGSKGSGKTALADLIAAAAGAEVDQEDSFLSERKYRFDEYIL
jgi:uridine kinase